MISTEQGCGVKNGTCIFPGTARGFPQNMPGGDRESSVPVMTPVMCMDLWMYIHTYQNHSVLVTKPYSNNCACLVTLLFHN